MAQPQNLQQICAKSFDEQNRIRQELGLNVLKCRVRVIDPISNQQYFLPEISDETIRIMKSITGQGLVKFLGSELARGNIKAFELMSMTNSSVPKLRDAEGNPLFFYAIGNSGTLDLLLDSYQIPVDTLNLQNGSTALIYAAGLPESSALIQSINLLLEKGADVNATNQEGETALMIAVGKLNYNVAKLLLEKGADANIEDNAGRIAKNYAHRNPKFIALLDQAGSN